MKLKPLHDRAKISRVKADMRTFATALEAYNVDYNKYPWSKSHSLFLDLL